MNESESNQQNSLQPKASVEEIETLRITLTELEKAVEDKTKEFDALNKKLNLQNEEKGLRAAELVLANEELVFQNREKENRAAELVLANKELIFQNNEKEQRASELIVANIELAYQNQEKEQRALELVIANTELLYQNAEKEKRASELVVANIELAYQNQEKEQRAQELGIANTELIYQNTEKEKRASELAIANIELAYQNQEKEQRALELVIANTELLYQNAEKEKRAAELVIANTELIFQNLEKEKRAAELLIANNELLSFTYITSHDLQEPLRKIQIFAEQIQQKDLTNLSETGNHYLKRIEASALQMQHLLQGLLTLSGLSSSSGRLENIPLTKLIDQLSPEIKADLAQKKVFLNLTDLGEAVVNPSQFSLALEQLFSNSLKFLKPANSPSITVKSEIIFGKDIQEKNISILKEQRYCHITFSDNGIGFEPEFNELVFEVFKRLHRREDYSGTGIGLAIVKKIIRNHNGIITARGELDKGVIVDIFIPAL